MVPSASCRVNFFYVFENQLVGGKEAISQKVPRSTHSESGIFDRTGEEHPCVEIIHPQLLLLTTLLYTMDTYALGIDLHKQFAYWTLINNERDILWKGKGYDR